MTDIKVKNGKEIMDSNKTSAERKGLILPDLKAHLIFWLFTVSGLAFDLWTKKAVFEWLENRHSYTVIGGFIELVRALNDGAAFGLFSGKIFLLTIVPIVALVASVAFFLFGGPQPRKVYVALGLVAAGACGNLYDRIFNGGLVRDFIDVYYGSHHWPTFNVADSLLCIGVAIIMLPMIWEVFIRKPAQTHAQQQK
jgi:signal peptidase II